VDVVSVHVHGMLFLFLFFHVATLYNLLTSKLFKDNHQDTRHNRFEN
jgi:hypothetical protein